MTLVESQSAVSFYFVFYLRFYDIGSPGRFRREYLRLRFRVFPVLVQIPVSRSVVVSGLGVDWHLCEYREVVSSDPVLHDLYPLCPRFTLAHRL